MPTPELETKPNRHPCHRCGKTFSTISHLGRHQTTHNRNRSHRCKFCNRTFNYQDSLRRHAKSCVQKGDEEPLPVLKRGPKARSCDLCHFRKLQCNGKSPCQRCLSGNVQCCYTHAIDNTKNHPVADHALTRTTIADSVDIDHRSLPFLLKYTDPSFHSVTDALAAAGARPEVLIDVTHLRQPSVHLFGIEMEHMLTTGPPRFFPDQVAENSVQGSRLSAGSSAPMLQSRIEELHRTLAAQHGKSAASLPYIADEFPAETLAFVFNTSSVPDFVSAYFDYFHPHFAFLHRPTFDQETASMPLLLAVALSGSVHLSPRDDALAARQFFDVGEEYVFSCLRQTVVDGGTAGQNSIEVVQAAQLIHSLQNSSNDEGRRRRIQVQRHPELVSAMRSLNLMDARRSQPYEISTWDQFITEEMRIRLAAGIFVIDSLVMLLLNSRPQITLSEMSSDLPCSDILFEANTESKFVEIMAASRPQICQLPNLKVVAALLLQESWSGPEDPRFATVDIKHLLILILAIHSMIFTARTALLLPSSAQSLQRATTRWKGLWDYVHSKPEAEYSQAIGFAKNSLELWWLGCKFLELASEGNMDGEYIRGIPTDSLTSLHEFIQRHAG